MAELIKMAVNENPASLSELDTDGLVVIVDPFSAVELRDESLRCLDWTLNHQIRKALEKSGNLPIFIPSMNKIKARYVVLCSMAGKKQCEENFQTLLSR